MECQSLRCGCECDAAGALNAVAHADAVSLFPPLTSPSSSSIMVGAARDDDEAAAALLLLAAAA
jgi:hypothetical protein